MEDLNANYVPMSMIEGITPNEALAMLNNVAQMHAHFWGSEIC